MPRRVLTPEQIASIPARIAAGETPAEIGADYGASRGAISYHIGDRARRRVLGSPWLPHVSAAKRALRASDYAAAAREYRSAADLCATRAT